MKSFVRIAEKEKRERPMYSIYGNLKRLAGLFAAAVLLSAFADNCIADSAAVSVINAGSGEVNIVIRNISDNQPAANGIITWSGVDAGQTCWKVADQYIEISHSNLPQFWGMQLYSDNKISSANPRYSGSADPAGLVKADNTIMAMPMAWKITDSLISSPSNPVLRSDNLGFSDYQWHFLKDKNTPDDPLTPDDERFVNGEGYVTLWNQAGIAWNEGGRSGNPKKAYIYLAADFTMSSVGSEYNTSTLTIEAYKGISPFPIYLYKDAPKTEYPDEPGATLENHFSPSGWFNYAGQTSVNPKYKGISPHSGTHCFRIVWNGSAGSDGWKWGGIMWLEPEDIWEVDGNSPAHNGYDLRGAQYLSFWARTNSSNSGLQIKAYFGNTWDSCGETSPSWQSPSLNTSWREYVIPVSGRDMSEVTGGLAIVFADDHDPNPDGCSIYLDDIKFDR